MSKVSHMQNTPSRPHSFLRNNRAVAAIEFALIIPILILVLLGTIEITRYVMINQKITTTASNLASYISQMRLPAGSNAPLSPDLVNAYEALIEPFNPANGGFIVTSVSRDDVGSDVSVNWQQKFNTGAVSEVPDNLGDVTSRMLPLAAGDPTDNLIVVEVFYDYDNIIPGASTFSKALDFDKNLYQRTSFLARAMPQPVGANVPNLPQPSGCCGSYCTGNNPPGVRCSGCVLAENGVTIIRNQQCALNARGRAFGLPDCVQCPPRENPSPPSECSLPDPPKRCFRGG